MKFNKTRWGLEGNGDRLKTCRALSACSMEYAYQRSGENYYIHLPPQDGSNSSIRNFGNYLSEHSVPEPRTLYRGADKSLPRPRRKQATATEDFEFHISYLWCVWLTTYHPTTYPEPLGPLRPVAGYFYLYLYLNHCAVAQWLRCCATNRKVASSIPDGVIGIFSVTSSFPQPLIEMSSRNTSWG
jgi:hypothetical protein